MAYSKERLMKWFSKSKKWPLPKFDVNDQPHFLFIITPPRSGSTALSQLLNTSHRTMILQNRGEGQWLVPGLCGNDRWNPDKYVNYLSVKAVWLRKYQEVKRLTQNVDVVIEKSPSNMVRIEELSSQFLDYSFLANNRDPYAYCASTLYRKYDGQNLNSDRRKIILGNLTKQWVTRSFRIQELVSRLNIPLLTYEKFCQNPSLVKTILNLPNGVSETIDSAACVSVKDYKIQPIINQNERQISKLSDEEIKFISQLLKSNSELLEFFEYQYLQ